MKFISPQSGKQNCFEFKSEKLEQSQIFGLVKLPDLPTKMRVERKLGFNVAAAGNGIYVDFNIHFRYTLIFLFFSIHGLGGKSVNK